MFWRQKYLVGFSLAAFIAAALLFALVTWFLWVESVRIEEARVADLAETLGQRTEQVIVDARDMLDQFNRYPKPACSPDHVKAMQEAAIARPYIRAIGYWRAAKRICGVGFIRRSNSSRRRPTESTIPALSPGGRAHKPKSAVSGCS